VVFIPEAVKLPVPGPVVIAVGYAVSREDKIRGPLGSGCPGKSWGFRVSFCERFICCAIPYVWGRVFASSCRTHDSEEVTIPSDLNILRILSTLHLLYASRVQQRLTLVAVASFSCGVTRMCSVTTPPIPISTPTAVALLNWSFTSPVLTYLQLLSHNSIYPFISLSINHGCSRLRRPSRRLYAHLPHQTQPCPPELPREAPPDSPRPPGAQGSPHLARYQCRTVSPLRAKSLSSRSSLTVEYRALQSAAYDLERQRASDSLKKGLEHRAQREDLVERMLLS
jgi:hypothetical protein